MTDERVDLTRAFGLLEAEGHLRSEGLCKTFPALCTAGIRQLQNHGRFSEWWDVVRDLHVPPPASADLAVDCPRVSAPQGELAPQRDRALEESLRKLGPWKKGPFSIFGTVIDAEWRSDMKWQRVRECAEPLAGRRVLDVGTGNGYFLLRAVGESASFVLGLEPSALYCAQYLAISRCFQSRQMAVLPLPAERFYADCQEFDTVLSMGVLYHRRSPLDHLLQLKSFMRPGGQLVLETLVVPGTKGYALLPEDRYAGMRNVWFLPSKDTLFAWLSRLGFWDIEMGQAVFTTPREQRATNWSGPVSLRDFLDQEDPQKTREGHPAPARLLVTATA